MKTLPWILVTILLFALLYRCQGGEENVQTVFDTITVVDTVTHDSVIPRDSVVIHYETHRLPIATDSTTQLKDSTSPSQLESDSVDVLIPITQKHYKEDDYELWISGYQAALDSIRLFRRESVLKPVIPPQKRKRWGFGLQAGYGIPGGWYVGAGVNWNIFTW